MSFVFDHFVSCVKILQGNFLHLSSLPVSIFLTEIIEETVSILTWTWPVILKSNQRLSHFGSMAFSHFTKSASQVIFQHSLTCRSVMLWRPERITHEWTFVIYMREGIELSGQGIVKYQSFDGCLQSNQTKSTTCPLKCNEKITTTSLEYGLPAIILWSVINL